MLILQLGRSDFQHPAITPRLQGSLMFYPSWQGRWICRAGRWSPQGNKRPWTHGAAPSLPSALASGSSKVRSSSTRLLEVPSSGELSSSHLPAENASKFPPCTILWKSQTKKPTRKRWGKGGTFLSKSLDHIFLALVLSCELPRKKQRVPSLAQVLTQPGPWAP